MDFKNDLKTIFTTILLIGVLVGTAVYSTELAQVEAKMGTFVTDLHSDLNSQLKNKEFVSKTDSRMESYPESNPESMPLDKENIKSIIDEAVEYAIKSRPIKLEKPVNTLLVGDSMMIEGFGPELERRLESEQYNVDRYGVYSSGLTVDKRINWSESVRQRIEQHQPKLVIASFGPNDGQTIYDQYGAHTVRSDSWSDAYYRKATNFVNHVFEKDPKPAYLVLVGQPMPRSADFQYKFKKINSVYKRIAAENNSVLFVESWDRFSSNGSYSNLVTNSAGVRAYGHYSDGIHLTRHGSGILSELVITLIESEIIEI